MRFNVLRNIFILLAVLGLTACGAPKNIAMSDNFWQEKPEVVITHYKAPEAGMTVSGAQGLLDMAITRMTNNGIINQLRTTDLTWYKNLPADFAKQLKQRSVASRIETVPVTNNSAVIARAGGNKVLAIKLKALGIRRVYSMGVFSNGAPQAYCLLTGELIDPRNDDKPLWRTEIEVVQPIQDPWDQAPHFQNAMLALNQATESAKTELLESFFSGA